MEAEARAVLAAATAEAPLDAGRLARLQARAIAAFGGDTAKAGEVERFLGERKAAWDE